MAQWRTIALLALFGACCLPLWAQHQSQCLPPGELTPVLVSNPEGRVTFKCEQATPMDLIHAVGFQTRIPIGLVLGRDFDALTKISHSYDIENEDAKAALAKALEGMDYTIKDENGVLVLLAGNLAQRQKDLLLHAYSQTTMDWPRDKMVCFGMMLTNRIRSAIRPPSGFAMSCSTSRNEEEFEIHIAPGATTEQIANQIVSQGSKGMWILKVVHLSRTKIQVTRSICCLISTTRIRPSSNTESIANVTEIALFASMTTLTNLG